MSWRLKEEEESGRVGFVNVKEIWSYVCCNLGGISSLVNGSEFFFWSL